VSARLRALVARHPGASAAILISAGVWLLALSYVALTGVLAGFIQSAG
jgi:hypothetical protein